MAASTAVSLASRASSSTAESTSSLGFYRYDSKPVEETPAPVGKVLRPPNAWILYRSEKLQEHRAVDLNGKRRPQAELSRVIADQWHNERTEVKKYYEQLAEVRKMEHAAQNPGYKYQPRKKRTVGGEMPAKRRRACSDGESDTTKSKRAGSRASRRAPPALHLTLPSCKVLPLPLPARSPDELSASAPPSLSSSAPAASTFERYIAPITQTRGSTPSSTWGPATLSDSDSTCLTPLLTADWSSGIDPSSSSEGFEPRVDYFGRPLFPTTSSAYNLSPVLPSFSFESLYAFEPAVMHGPTPHGTTPKEDDSYVMPAPDFAFPARTSQSGFHPSSLIGGVHAPVSPPSNESKFSDWWDERNIRITRDGGHGVELQHIITPLGEPDLTLARQQSTSSLVSGLYWGHEQV